MDRVKIDISTSTIIKIVLAVIAVWFLYTVRDVLVLLFIVLVVVAALAPLVDRMSRHIPRVLSVIILSIIFIGVLVAIGFLILPPIIDQIRQLAINLPLISSKLGPVYQSIQNSIGNYQEGLFNLSSQLGKISNGIYSTTLGFLSGIVAFLTILVLSFYMLLEQKSIEQVVTQTIPLANRAKLIEIIQKIGAKMGSWLRGHLLLMLIVGLLDGLGLMVLGIPFALTLGVWGGLVEIIPYLGPWLGLIPALVIAFTISPFKALLVLIIYLIIQQIEAQFLTPKILGKAVGLSPVIIILALLIGAKLMGILGVLISVPIAATLSVVIQEWHEIKTMLKS